MENRRKTKTAVLFLIIIFALPIILIFSKKEYFSPEENRSLEKFPEVSAENIRDKSFMDDVESYLSDHFPARLGFVRTKMNAERIAGKNCINGIYITDERLIERISEPDSEATENSVGAINNFAEKCSADVFVSVVPTSAGIYREETGRFSPQLNQHAVITDIYKRFSSDVTAIDVFNPLSAASDEYIYYRNDHHWTSRGAYIAYKSIIAKLGFSAVSEDYYDIEHVTDDFKGTFYSKCLYDGVKADVIDIYSCKNGFEAESVVMNDGAGETVADDIYFREFLSGNDKYCVFLGENRAFTDIKTNTENGKSIMVIKDSYANSFVPFLVQHYSRITVIDPRYVKGSLEDFADPDEYDQILFLYNASTFSTDKNLRSLLR
ncbi:MAG: DHHW family protein [Porcipelethomonas sp.]